MRYSFYTDLVLRGLKRNIFTVLDIDPFVISVNKEYKHSPEHGRRQGGEGGQGEPWPPWIFTHSL